MAGYRKRNAVPGVDPNVLSDFVESLPLDYNENSVSYIFVCPRCSKRKLYVSKRSGRFVCWRCKEIDNFQGRPEYAFAELLGERVTDLQSRLYGHGIVQAEIYLDVEIIDFFGDGDEVPEDVIQHLETAWPLDYYPIGDKRATRGLSYLEGRGIPESIATEYGIHFSPTERSVAFPICSQGKLYGWQNRLVVSNEWIDEDGERHEVPKTKTTKGLRRDRLLMFSDRLQADHAVLCEGPVDAIKAHFAGGNVCAMGKAVSPMQLELLRTAGIKKLYIALDPDAAEEINRLVSELSSEMELYEMQAKGNSKPDLGAMSFKEVFELFRGAPRIHPGRLFIFLHR